MANVQEDINTAVGAMAASEIIETEGVQINWDNARRHIVVGINITGRDPGSVVADGQRLLSFRLSLPSGYYGEFSF